MSAARTQLVESLMERFSHIPPEAVLKEDLLRTLSRGIEGTTMPSFGLLHHQELEDLASYVIHLSLRGETEFRIMEQILKDDTETVQIFKGRKQKQENN